MILSRCVVSMSAAICLMASTTAAVAAQPVRPASSNVAMAVAGQSATTSADQNIQAVSTKKSPHAKGTELVLIGLGVAAGAAAIAAAAGGGDCGCCPAHSAAITAAAVRSCPSSPD